MLKKIFAASGFVLMILISTISMNAQELEYDIIWLGKIGKLSINKTADEGKVFIRTNSEVKIPFYTFSWITTATIQNEKLNASEYSQLLNGNKREFTEITRTSENSWKVTNDKGEAGSINILNPFYVSKLYFEEPVNINYVFSERFAEPLQLVDQGNGQYRLMLPEENYCDYFYEEGICKMVKAKNGRRTIKMVLVDPKG